MPLQPKFFNGRLRHQKMAEVNRVEGTAKQTDALHGAILVRGAVGGDGNQCDRSRQLR